MTDSTICSYCKKNLGNAYLECGKCHSFRFCSDECSDAISSIHKEECFDFVEMKRGRPEKDVDDLYALLESKLSKAKEEVFFLEASHPQISNRIKDSLLRHGIAFISVNPDIQRDIAQNTGRNMANAFEKLPEKVKQDLQNGTFDSFSKDWQKQKVVDRLIASKSSGMANKMFLKTDARTKYTHPITKTVHRPSEIPSVNNIEMWEILSRYNPGLHPFEWFKMPLKEKDDFRVNVSEDGLKILEKTKYKPTGIHYDGQLSTSGAKQAHRVQIIYTNDKGPVRLFVVPGSHRADIQKLITDITGISQMGKAKGFETHGKVLEKNPRLKKLLYKYGVSIPSTGLIMFVANVWHYEAKEKKREINSFEDNGLAFVDMDHKDDIQNFTKESSVFRIYCGVVSVKPTSLIKDLIVFAYLREHLWAMDPFSTPNNKHPLFVNSKSTQSWIGAATNVGEWSNLKNASMNTMKAYLKQNVSKNRLKLYGLEEDDLILDIPIIINIEGE